MSEARFRYDNRLLSSCALSQLAAYITRDGYHDWQESSSSGSDRACSLLHQQHAEHYGRPAPRAMNKKVTSNNSVSYELDERLQLFVENVLRVHTHNSNRKHLHRLTLNRFADGEVPKYLDQPWSWEYPFKDWDSIEKEVVLSSRSRHQDDEEVVEIAANLTFGRGGLKYLNHKKKKKPKHRASLKNTIAEKLKFPDRDAGQSFAVPMLDDPDMNGELLKVKPRHRTEREVESGDFEETDPFGKYLDWSAWDNPDGVPIVHDPIDQGDCGSCWAAAATGTLEASVSRTQAHEAFNEYLENASLRQQEGKDLDLLHDEAVKFARSVEEAALLSLSIQELISCDTAADEGCIGGNPLLAFYFIHRYGLTSRNQYPYVGHEETCKKSWVSRPVAKVKSWGIISPNHEHHMVLALRFIGPIAVGINGAERSFLAYQDGIFDKPYCRQGANHALLITGYGQEETHDGNIVKYWIARNSWGTDWGENGYVRVKRGDGLKGTRGVCGIARSPSVALGGVLLANRHRLAPYHTPKSSQTDSNPMSTSSSCDRLGFEPCHGIIETLTDYKALVLGATGLLCATFLAVWPLTFQCRRRRQRRRRARENQSLEPGNPSCEDVLPPPPQEAPPSETDPLLGDRNATRYGE